MQINNSSYISASNNYSIIENESKSKANLQEGLGIFSGALPPHLIDQLDKLKGQELAKRLLEATKQGDVPVVKYIIEKNDINPKFIRRLATEAVKIANLSILKILHAKGDIRPQAPDFFLIHNLCQDPRNSTRMENFDVLGENCELFGVINFFRAIDADFSLCDSQSKLNVAETAALMGDVKVLRCLVAAGICSKTSFDDRFLQQHIRHLMGYDRWESLKILKEIGLKFHLNNDFKIADFITSLRCHASDNFVNSIALFSKEIMSFVNTDDLQSIIEGNDTTEPLVHTLFRDGKITLLKLLMEYGLDIDVRDRDGNTIAHGLVKKGSNLLFTELLALYELGADFTLTNSATKMQHGWNERRLLNMFGAVNPLLNPIDFLSVQFKEDDEHTPFIAVVKAIDYLDKVRTDNISDALVTIDKWPQVISDIVCSYMSTPLNLSHHLAARDERPTLSSIKDIFTKALFTKGEIDEKALKMALRTGVNINETISRSSENFNTERRTLATYAASIGDLRALKYLRPIADMRIRDQMGETPVYAAGRSQNLEVINFFIGMGLDVSEAAYGAAECDNTELLELLISRKCNIVNPTDRDTTTFHMAARYGKGVTAVALLLQHIDDINIKDSHGKTALHYAAREGHEKIIKFFFNNGADFALTDADRKTAWDLYFVDYCRQGLFPPSIQVAETFYRSSRNFRYTPISTEDYVAAKNKWELVNVSRQGFDYDPSFTRPIRYHSNVKIREEYEYELKQYIEMIARVDAERKIG